MEKVEGADNADPGEELFYCPLIEQSMCSAYCYDLNFQSAGNFVKPDILLTVMEVTGKTKKEVDNFCSQCPRYSFH